MKKYFLLACALLAGVIFLPAESSAQYNIMSGYNSTYLAIEAAGASQRADALREGLRSNRNAANSGKTNVGTKAPNKNAVRGKVTFSSSGAFIVPKQAAAKFGKTAEQKREAEGAFVKALNEFEDVMKTKGYAKNDVARAAAVLFQGCIFSYTGKQLTQKQLDGAYQAFKNYYETDAYFQSLDEREKQRTYETSGLLWATVFINYVKAQEKGDRESLRQSKDAAETIFKAFLGTSINDVRLTADGFELN